VLLVIETWAHLELHPFVQHVVQENGAAPYSRTAPASGTWRPTLPRRRTTGTPRPRRCESRRPWQFLPEGQSAIIDQYNNEYAIQDEKEHTTEELVVPPHSDVYMHFRIETMLSFTRHHFVMYFDGDGNKVLTIKNWSMSFIKEGESEKSPTTHKTHYIDYHGGYHIAETRERAKGDFGVYAFNLKTRDSGKYDAIIEINADGVRTVVNLVVNVLSNPNQKMRCTAHWGCFISPDPTAWIEASKPQA
jgi:hypothetical protein